MFGSSIQHVSTERSIGNAAGSHEKKGGFGGRWAPGRRPAPGQEAEATDEESGSDNSAAICRARLESFFAAYLEA